MLRFDIYVGEVLYLQTFNQASAFAFFRRQAKNKNSVRMQFVMGLK